MISYQSLYIPQTMIFIDAERMKVKAPNMGEIRLFELRLGTGFVNVRTVMKAAATSPEFTVCRF
jgi:hypothetical protein